MGPERVNVSTLVDGNLEAGRGQKVAIYHGDEQVTYQQLHERVCAAGRALQNLGIRREERVLLILDDTPELPTVFLGAIRIGAVPVPVNPRMRQDDYRFFVEDSYARVVVAEPERVAEVEAALEGLDVTVVGSRAPASSGLSFLELLSEHAGRLEPVAAHPEDPAFWLYSSGSTGAPKGVVHAHRHVFATCENYAAHILGVGPEDVMFSSTKLYHAYGLGNGMTFPYWAGASSVLMGGRPKPEAILDTAERFRPTLFFSVPTLYNSMLHSQGASRRDLSSVRLCASAAEPLPAAVWQSWHDTYGLTILDGIGSTEMLHIYCSNRADEVKPGSSGKPVPGYEIELRSPEDGRPVSAGEPGDMYVAGDSVLSYYWHRRAKTMQTLHGEWFSTGDRYRRDADGFYWYEGRADDMMKVGGMWCSPAEIENTLMEHAAVHEVATVGVEREGLAKIRAFVVLNETEPSEALTEELQEWCKQRLERYEFPHFVEYVDDLPKTATGKLQRFKLRERA